MMSLIILFVLGLIIAGIGSFISLRRENRLRENNQAQIFEGGETDDFSIYSPPTTFRQRLVRTLKIMLILDAVAVVAFLAICGVMMTGGGL